MTLALVGYPTYANANRILIKEVENLILQTMGSMADGIIRIDDDETVESLRRKVRDELWFDGDARLDERGVDKHHMFSLVDHELELLIQYHKRSDRPLRDLAARQDFNVGSVLRAIEFFVALEGPDLEQPRAETYGRRLVNNAHAVEAAENVLKGFAEKLEDRTLNGMQAAYYGVTNSVWVRARGNLWISVARTVLNQAFKGVGAWQV